jgi:fatty acid desaturase
LTIPQDNRIEHQSAPLFVRKCSELVRDLYRPNPRIYFTDFFVSLFVSLICFVLYQHSNDFYLSIGIGVLAGLAIYRCSIFIHEIQHHPVEQLRPFACVWNLFFGIPFLMPLFLYDEHSAHHALYTYGTKNDSEYLSLRSARVTRSFSLMAISLFYPLLGPLRFALFTPLALLSYQLNHFIFTVMSTLYNLKPGYRRPWGSAAVSPARWFQEICCCLWAWAWIASGIIGLIAPNFFWKTYLLFAFWMSLNQLRTLTAHRYARDESHQGPLSQLLDTNTFDCGWGPLAWAPLGLRYHALHHLLPSLPYHNLHNAHLRLLEALPSDSPYHQTRKLGLGHAIYEIFVLGL